MTTSTSKTQMDHYHHSSTTATTTMTTMEDEWGLETHMSWAIGVFFFCLILLFFANFLFYSPFNYHHDKRSPYEDIHATSTTSTGTTTSTSTSSSASSGTNSLQEKAQTTRYALFGPYVSFFLYIRFFFLCAKWYLQVVSRIQQRYLAQTTQYTSFGPLVSVFFF